MLTGRYLRSIHLVIFTEWSCNRENDQIHIFWGDAFRGSYQLLQEPYCKFCAHAGVKTNDCQEHHDLSGFKRIYTIGQYFPITTGSDFLTKHIRILKKYKTHSVPLGSGLEVIIRELYPELLKSTIIVPVPQHPDKFNVRGYNQALELSNVLGAHINLPVIDVLIKTQDIDLRPLSREERRVAVENMYIASNMCIKSVKGENVLIVDDVVTTGFTSSKCAHLLLEAGAESVNVIAAGRTA
jgi:predicted amidophosphoribosyltransferase